MIHYAEPDAHHAPIDEEAMEKMNSWRPPRPAVGQTVLFYPQALKSSAPNRAPGLATVWKIGERSIDLRDGHGNYMPGVSYISDPKLDHFTHLRDAGCWDFTEHDKNLEKLHGLAETVKKLQEEVSALKAAARASK